MFGLDDEIAEARPGRDDDLRHAKGLIARHRQQVLIGRDPGLALGLAGPRRLPDPFQLVLQRALARRLLAFLLRQAFLLLLQPRRIVPLIGNALTAIDFQDPSGDVVEKIAIVGHHHDGAVVILEEPLQPCHRLGVQMVGGLVQQQHVRMFQQQPAERHPPPFAAGQRRHVGIAGRTAQRVHRHLQGPLQLPSADGVDLLLQIALLRQQHVHLVVVEGLGEPEADGVELVDQSLGRAEGLQDVLLDGLGGIQFRLLRQISDANAVGGPGLALELGVHAGHDLHQGRFAGAVDAEDADLGAGKKRQGDVLENLAPTGKCSGQSLHHVDVLIGGHGPLRT